MRDVHLICNAHIDPIWQWEWEEGAAETVSTFRTAAEICEENEDFVFCHNESLLYGWIEEFDPALFKRIQALVAQGRWRIMGGWFVQPDCNMPTGESFIRQMRLGQSYFMKKFGTTSKVAINLDPFGHNRGLVQLLTKAGYKGYLITRPGENEFPYPDEDFLWVGFDGSVIPVHRAPAYGTAGFGDATRKINYDLKRRPDVTPEAVLWGVGDHGGGPSKRDVKEIAELQAQRDDLKLHHSCPDDFFDALKASGKAFPRVDVSLNPFAVGCYTSQSRVKKAHRELESMLANVERLCAHASAVRGLPYPAKEIHEAEYDLCMCEFHDVLPGSSIQPAEEMAVRVMGHGVEILSRLRMRAFLALSSGEKKAADGEIPILAYNPHPYPIRGEFDCEFMLAAQNWEDNHTIPRVFKDGVEIPSQLEKERSNLSLDWRKRVSFAYTLAPMTVTRFDCRVDLRVPEKPVPTCGGDEDAYVFANGEYSVRIGKKTGLLESYKVNGKEYLTGASFEPVLVEDCADPWEMRKRGFPGKETPFTLVSPEECARVCGVPNALPAVHVIESGAVRTVIEAVLECEDSRAVIRYTLPVQGKAIDVQARAIFLGKDKILKLKIRTPFKDRYIGQKAYGWEDMWKNGDEVVAQRWVMTSDNQNALSVLTSVYGSDFKDGVVRLSLLRGAGYTAHPIGDRELLPSDRYSSRIDQGERVFEFRLQGGEYEERIRNIERESAAFFEPPFVLSFFPSGNGESCPAMATLSDSPVDMVALRETEDGKDWMMRLYNPSEKEENARVALPFVNAEADLTLKPFEVKTLRVNKQNGALSEANLLD